MPVIRQGVRTAPRLAAIPGATTLRSASVAADVLPRMFDTGTAPGIAGSQPEPAIPSHFASQGGHVPRTLKRIRGEMDVKPTPRDKGLTLTLRITAYDNGMIEVDGVPINAAPT
jgi:hypothetical protein